jgi:DNA topoisomerase-1
MAKKKAAKPSSTSTSGSAAKKAAARTGSPRRAAKAAGQATGRPLVIVESPAKAKTIRGYLGAEYIVEASVGHIRDLPHGADEIPKELKKEPWSKIGVNVEQDFEPLYVVSPEKRKQVAKLKSLLAEASSLYLATDEDREGEAISWHLTEVLKPKVDVHRLVFHEITRKAILEALEHPRDINESLVNAQETRRIVDRLYGYEVSPLLWKKVGPRLSAGRVQSVAVRLLVDRERQRMAFRSGTWWDLQAAFAAGGPAFDARLTTLDGRPLAKGSDFDPATGRLKDDRPVLLGEDEARGLEARLRDETFTVASREDRPFTQRPSPPFTTSTLQQEANRKHGFTARRTMQVAQGLYENGHITYMRTDSTTLAGEAVAAIRRTVESLYGADHLPAAPRAYQTKVANAQEAHEAIRPAGSDMPTPESLRGRLDTDGLKLYELIWKRTMACQMADARGQQTTLTVASSATSGPVAVFQSGGKTIEFAGFLRAYVEGSDDPAADLADKETLLPPLAVGARVECRSLEAASHSTQPPARYTEATLTKALEERGIGRPSTYAATIDTILRREYCRKRGNALVPTWVGFAVAQLLVDHLPELIDYQFTAQMEEDLDAISRGEGEKLDYLRRFYFGDGRPGLKDLLAESVDRIDPRAASSVHIAATVPGREGLVVRVGRYGPFIESEGRRVSLPSEDVLAPDELTPGKCDELLSHAALAEQPLGHDPETGKPVYKRTGRFGPYVQLGTADDDEKPRMASLLKGMSLETLDLPTALRLLSLPRRLGNHPASGAEIKALNGRFGPYVTCDGDSRSLPPDLSPLDVTLEQALALLAQPKLRGKRAVAASLKTLGDSPVTGKPVEVKSGRYGPYVADGATNASLPKTADPATVTLEQALELLAARAAAGPPVKRGRAKKAAPRGRRPSG